ncbi:hypothetical protein [Legionella sp. W05-934-2]|jgi:hypothetical protein|uniref:hypothetical protein n=1 Tax=Legionella sp. W05-934-2 TaxID=1198649 RepID=UPI00346318CE
MPLNPNQLPVSAISHFVANPPNNLNDKQRHHLITETNAMRKLYNKQVTTYNEHLLSNQIMVKACVTATLGIGLFFAAPATLLLGGAVALALGSGIYSYLPFPEATINSQAISARVADDAEPNASTTFVTNWLFKMKDHDLTDEQSRLYHNMYRIGVGLIVGFAAFTAIVSGAGISLTIAAALFALSLAYIVQPKSTLYDETAEPAHVRV